MYQVVPCCAKKFQQSSLAFGHEGPKGRGAHMCSLTSMFGWLNEWRNDWLNHKLNNWIGHWRMHEWMIEGSRTSVRLFFPGKLLLLAICCLIILAKSSLKPAPSPRNFAWASSHLSCFFSGPTFLCLLWATFPLSLFICTLPLYHMIPFCFELHLVRAISFQATSSLSYLFSEPIQLLWANSSVKQLFSAPHFLWATSSPLSRCFWRTLLKNYLSSRLPLRISSSASSLSHFFNATPLVWAASSVHCFYSQPVLLELHLLCQVSSGLHLLWPSTSALSCLFCEA
jgi:hypothetical protein